MKNGLYYEDGAKVWYKNDLLHNENGPAAEFTDGYKAWYINDKLHRLDGPAQEYPNGEKYWYYEDQEIEYFSQKEFEQLIKLKVLW